MGSAAVTAVAAAAAMAAGQKQMAERERFEPLLLLPPPPSRRDLLDGASEPGQSECDREWRRGRAPLAPCSFHPEPTQIFIGESGFSGTPKTSPDSSYFPLALKTLLETYK